jgi:hypothetical protein
MEESWTQLFIGVGAGILAIWLVFLARFTMAGVVAPLINFISPEREITGKWETTFKKTIDDEEIENQESAELHQIGRNVYGKILNRGREPHRQYKMRGTLREGILVATYETVGSGAILDRGAFTLRVHPDGNGMSGFYAWTDDEMRMPSADRYEWRKVNG